MGENREEDKRRMKRLAILSFAVVVALLGTVAGSPVTAESQVLSATSSGEKLPLPETPATQAQPKSPELQAIFPKSTETVGALQATKKGLEPQLDRSQMDIALRYERAKQPHVDDI